MDWLCFSFSPPATTEHIRCPVSWMQQETAWSHPISGTMQLATSRSHIELAGGGDMRKGEQTRQEIIRKAAPIFNQRGYDGAALSDLMEATGLEKGGIYRHFDSKQQLAEIGRHTSELQSQSNLVCRLLLEKKKYRHKSR